MKIQQKLIAVTLLCLVSFALYVLSPQAQAASVKTESSKQRVKVSLRKHSQRHHQGRSAALGNADQLLVHSAVALVHDVKSGATLYEKNASEIIPIASITKLMTAMVVLDAEQDLHETLTISKSDRDIFKGSRSRLPVGTQLEREELLSLALMASENRAAYTLSSNFPGGRVAFVAAMNRKAQELGMNDSHFVDPTGLNANNTSSARDLMKMVNAAHDYPLIRKDTTTVNRTFRIRGRQFMFRNTNRLVKNSAWDIEISKTGYIAEAGKCLVMYAAMNDKPTIIVLLDSQGKLTRVGDAKRIKRWMERTDLAGQRRTSTS